MSDIRVDGWEWLHYDNPAFPVQYRKNVIPAHCALTAQAPIRDVSIEEPGIDDIIRVAYGQA